MTDILHSPLQFPSPSSSINSTTNDGVRNCSHIQEAQQEDAHLSVLALFLTVFRKSLVSCTSRRSGDSFGAEEQQLMEIGWPTNFTHVAHVTFDRFNGFLGLPVEFEPQVPRRPPSASTRVFGVSTKSMQLSFDSRGNCVPTILLMMQRCLYSQGGLRSEGIFRINPDNSQEEYVREQLNNGLIPENIDVHCLAGLIKAWFRELPNGILDSIPPQQMMEAQSQDECTQLVRILPPIEAALLDWAINLMADVAQLETLNKMNPRNIAMVFAPNMTQMSDPLTALMYTVQVMNFLKTLISKTLRERKDCLVEDGVVLQLAPSDEDSEHDSSKPINLKASEDEEEEVIIAIAKSRNGNDANATGTTLVENTPCDGNRRSKGRSRMTKQGRVKKGSMQDRSKGLMIESLRTTERVETWR